MEAIKKLIIIIKIRVNVRLGEGEVVSFPETYTDPNKT